MIVQNTTAQIKEPIVKISSTNAIIVNTDGLKKYQRKSDDYVLDGKYKFYLNKKETQNNSVNDIFGIPTGLVEEGIFKNGYKDGLWKTIYENKLVKTENYNVGSMIGRYSVYKIDGDLLFKTTFGSQGNGKYQDYYYTTGILKEEGFYKNGKRDGEWCTFNEKGKLLENTIYNEGVIQE